MQRGDFASGGWQKLIETLLTGLMHVAPAYAADIIVNANVRMSASGTKRTYRPAQLGSMIDPMDDRANKTMAPWSREDVNETTAPWGPRG